MAGRNFQNFVSRGAISYTPAAQATALIMAAATIAGVSVGVSKSQPASGAPRSLEANFQRVFAPPAEVSMPRYDGNRNTYGIVCVPRGLAAPGAEVCDQDAPQVFAMR